jgi:lactoylglutathione lyase
VHSEEPELRELGHELAGEVALLEPVADLVEDVVSHELAHRVPNRPLLVVEERVERQVIERVERARFLRHGHDLSIVRSAASRPVRHRTGVSIRERRSRMFREPFPILHVSDVDRSVRFYCESFGFEIAFRWPEDGQLEFAFLKLGDTGIGIGGAEPPPLPDWPAGRDLGSFQLCIYAEDTDAAADRLRVLGVTQVAAPREMPWGEKLAFFEDPDGNLVHVTAVLDRDGDGSLES